MGTFGHSTIIYGIFIEQWFKQKIYVIYFIKMHLGPYIILLFKKLDTMCDVL